MSFGQLYNAILLLTQELHYSNTIFWSKHKASYIL